MAFQFVVSCSSPQEGFSCSKLCMLSENSSASRTAKRSFTSREKQTYNQRDFERHELSQSHNFWEIMFFIYKIMKMLHSLQYLYFCCNRKITVFLTAAAAAKSCAKLQSAFYVHGFHICRFSQPQKDNIWKIKFLKILKNQTWIFPMKATI